MAGRWGKFLSQHREDWGLRQTDQLKTAIIQYEGFQYQRTGFNGPHFDALKQVFLPRKVQYIGTVFTF